MWVLLKQVSHRRTWLWQRARNKTNSASTRRWTSACSRTPFSSFRSTGQGSGGAFTVTLFVLAILSAEPATRLETQPSGIGMPSDPEQMWRASRKRCPRVAGAVEQRRSSKYLHKVSSEGGRFGEASRVRDAHHPMFVPQHAKQAMICRVGPSIQTGVVAL